VKFHGALPELVIRHQPTTRVAHFAIPFIPRAKPLVAHGVFHCGAKLWSCSEQSGRTSKVLDREHKANYVPSLFQKGLAMSFRVIIEEAAVLASLTLFLGMIAIWAQVIATL
jgi:hypothetical protein